MITEEAEPHHEQEEKEGNQETTAEETDEKIINSEENTEEASGDRIFIPLLENQGLESKISSHFGHAPFFAIYDTKTKKLDIKENVIDHTDQIKTPVDQVMETANPTVVFAIGIGARAIQLFNEKGIEIKTGNYNILKEVIDNLDKLTLQGESCHHEEHHHH